MMNKTSIAIGAALLTVAGLGCGGNDSSGPLGNVDSLVILQRVSRNDTGDIFQYTSYVPGARLVKLSPPTANGTLTTLCCDTQGPDFAAIDIQAYDISFDAKSIVFAGKTSDSTNYGLYILQLADGSVQQLASDPGRDYVSPIFLPGDKIMFTTNSVVSNPITDVMPPQHRDEYERGMTIQMGTMNVDGTGEELGPRNLSHRTAPSLASDGRVIFTQWDHLGPENAGHLMFMNTDMTELREAFGKEGTGVSNSTMKAREISPGRFVAIASDRDRTLQSGALVDIRLGYPSTLSNGDVVANTAMSEAHASAVILTPDVPLDRSPSANTIGRYYDAYPLNAKENPDLLVSWADGPVESSVLSAAGVNANFGVYLYDTANHQRHPILDDPAMWDIFARPLVARDAPGATSSQVDSTSNQAQALIGAMNVYDSTLHTFQQGEIYGVRVMEGFSSEEGFPEMFGTTMFEGHADLGVARVANDGSWLAHVPANVPLHLQAVDVYGMSLFNEPVWFSARPGESRVCGGCHEDRAASTIINPGITMAAAIGPTDAMSLVPRANRMNATPSGPDKLVGVAWDTIVQPVFDAHCISCHNGTTGAANPSYTITNPATGVATTFTFDLTNKPITMNFGTKTETYPASYWTMAGPDMEAIEKGGLVVSGNFKVYMNPEDAHGSIAIQYVNPTQLFPSVNPNVRAFTTQPHSAAQGYTELSPQEFYTLILAADMGVNYYARENNPHSTAY
jgi:hypothetical protein